ERVVISVPDGEAALAEPRRDLPGRQPVYGERERRHPAGHRRQTVEAAARRKPVQESLSKRPFPAKDRVPPDRLDVLDGGDHAGEELVGLRAGLEAMTEGLLRLGAHL